MKVLKFGGSSVANAEKMNRVIDMILKSSEKENSVIIVSALGGITDDLVRLATLASKRVKYTELFKNICERHNRVIKELMKTKNRKTVLREVNKKYHEMEEVIRNIFRAEKFSLSSLDAVMSFGEKLSAYIISEAIKARGVECEFIDARTLIKTDSNFGEANVNIKKTYELISKHFKNGQNLSIMGGFIASTDGGETTTLGRGGSDYTASLVAAALDASSLELWKDVDGLMTGNPKTDQNAVIIPKISYEKAEKMARKDAKVIHPKTIKPVQLQNIPIFIKNVFNLRAKGTKISKGNEKIPVGILGATGMVGQKLICLLRDHPWFTVACVAASEKSTGKTYGEAVEKRWVQKEPVPEDVKALNVSSVESDLEIIAEKCSFVFSAIDADKDFIKKIEESYADKGLPVISNNSAHRWTKDVPMIIPEINPYHLDIIPIQKKNRGWTTGFIITKPNCSLQSYIPLIHTWKQFDPEKVIVSTYQAISGAGKTFQTWPEMADNIMPYISGEEEKSEKEPKKILGEIKKGKFVLSKFPKISASCIRVPVSDGHMATINIKFKKKVSKEQLIKTLKNFKNPLDKLNLLSAPKPFLTYFKEDNRPQIRLDRDLHGGMGISIGRIREDSVLGWKCVALSHNTVRGAAGGSILTAELLVKKGYII